MWVAQPCNPSSRHHHRPCGHLPTEQAAPLRKQLRESAGADEQLVHCKLSHGRCGFKLCCNEGRAVYCTVPGSCAYLSCRGDPCEVYASIVHSHIDVAEHCGRRADNVTTRGLGNHCGAANERLEERITRAAFSGWSQLTVDCGSCSLSPAMFLLRI